MPQNELHRNRPRQTLALVHPVGSLRLLRLGRASPRLSAAYLAPASGARFTEAEAAFRTAKNDLKLRPIYHQKTARVEAHILVCFLALAQWRVLEQWMSRKGLGTCARKLVAEISTIKSMAVIMPVKRGEERSELTVRTVARPERRVAELLTRLELPTRNRILNEPAHAPAGVREM